MNYDKICINNFQVKNLKNSGQLGTNRIVCVVCTYPKRYGICPLCFGPKSNRTEKDKEKRQKKRKSDRKKEKETEKKTERKKKTQKKEKENKNGLYLFGTILY